MTEKQNPQNDIATRIMAAMVKMPPKPHKDDSKPPSKRGEAQQRRREREKASHRAIDSDH
jgi:hypothetical protein